MSLRPPPVSPPPTPHLVSNSLSTGCLLGFSIFLHMSKTGLLLYPPKTYPCHPHLSPPTSRPPPWPCGPPTTLAAPPQDPLLVPPLKDVGPVPTSPRSSRSLQIILSLVASKTIEMLKSPTLTSPAQAFHPKPGFFSNQQLNARVISNPTHPKLSP